MVNIPLFTGFYTSQVVQDVLQQQSKQMLFFNFGSMAGTKQSMTCGCVSGTTIIRDFDVVPRLTSGLTCVISRCTKGPHKLPFCKKPPKLHFATTMCYPIPLFAKAKFGSGTTQRRHCPGHLCWNSSFQLEKTLKTASTIIYQVGSGKSSKPTQPNQPQPTNPTQPTQPTQPTPTNQGNPVLSHIVPSQGDGCC